MAYKDAEIELYRSLMERPETYTDGFDGRSLAGALFVGFVMMPGAIYLGLVAGISLGDAAQWVTIILFSEIARRSFVRLNRAQIYILYYIAAGLTAMYGGMALSGGAFAQAIWWQYFVRSQAAKGLGIADKIPTWLVPRENSAAIVNRTFFDRDWLLPGLLIVGQTILNRLNWFAFGYLLFRETSDYEKLPYPFAAITAQGATALAEAGGKDETWRWRIFSIGAMIGLVFGAVYVGIPTITSVIMTQPLQLIPIPFVDLTRSTQSIWPAVPMGFMTDLGTVLGGFVIPFWAVVGSAIAALATIIINPQLQRAGILNKWTPGMDAISTQFANQLDFYLSVGIGATMAVAILGAYEVLTQYFANVRARRAGEESTATWAPPAGRGDFPLWIAVAIYVGTTLGYVFLCHWLVPDFPIWWIVGFGFIVTPINSYVNARMIGLTGQYIGIPMLKNAVIIFSGYKNIDIWFAPIPDFNHGDVAQQFRVLELTGNKIISLVKAEITIWPITIFASLIFWQFIWKLGPIPSTAYPYALKMWHLQALQNGIWYTATLNPEQSPFVQAWKWEYFMGGMAGALALYSVLRAFRLPILLIYGLIRSFGILPHFVFPQLLGALISQYYFIPRLGARRWKQYATVLWAGYACGMGLVGMVTVALVLIGKSVSQMPY
ncbi:MAG TPA: peptide transporter [Armatimonadota bacterium]